MNKNLALFVALVLGIFVFGLVVMMQVPRKETAMQDVAATTSVAVTADITTDLAYRESV